MLPSNMLLLNLTPLIDVTFSTPTPDYTYPMKGDVKGKILPPPLGGEVGVVTCIQPRLILRRVIGLAALARRRF